MRQSRIREDKYIRNACPGPSHFVVYYECLNMAATTDHTPKQAKALASGSDRVDLYNATGGAVTAQFAAHNFTLIPSIPSGSIVHDNACGDGTVSRAILTSDASQDIKIHATDIDQVFLDALSATANGKSWPIDISNQKCENLSFSDDYFTHSITNIGIIFATNGGLDGAREIYRTLKPGGTAVVNCWQHVTWLPAFMRAQAVTRPNVPFAFPPVTWGDGQQIQKIMKEAGFKTANMRVETSEAWAKTSDLREWAEKSWAFLGGVASGWHEGDEEKWDQAVDTFVEALLLQEGTKKVGEEVWMKASQWVVVATK
jgi:ubiquinone/menaquinone biosynthesis C-methylase UbiE